MKKQLQKFATITLFIALISSGITISKAQNIYTVAGNGTGGYSGDGGQATAAAINQPTGVFLDMFNNIYIADSYNNRIRKVNSTTGVITTIAGTGAPGFSGDGGPATAAKVNGPNGVTVDMAGNIYIADFFNNRIRKINTSGIISTIAGVGTAGFSGDGGPATAAQMVKPIDLAFDMAGNLYIADGNNCVRKINTAGIITTVVGTRFFGYSGDGGPATAAKINYPGGITVDMAGNLYVADYFNNRIRIVNPAGIINTFAGTGTGGSTGDGGLATAATLSEPSDIVFDAAGNSYIADASNARIRVINPSNIINTLAGTTTGFSGDGGPANAAQLDFPSSVAIDNACNLFVADTYNNRIRAICMGCSGRESNPTSDLSSAPCFANAINNISNKKSISIYPNPSNGIFILNSTEIIDEIKITDILGNIIYMEKPNAEKINLRLNNSGIYFISAKIGDTFETQKMIVE